MEENKLRYFPTALFASVMGLSGVTVALRQYEKMTDLAAIGSTLFFILALVMFIVNLAVLIVRLKNFPKDIHAELKHPVKMNFYGAISISFLMIGLLLYDMSEILSLFIWGIGAFLQLTLTLYLLTRLMWTLEFKLEQFNPVWFLPIVGNIVVPLAGVYHVGAEINWLFFSLGLVFTIFYFTFFFNRMFFHGPLPPMLRPTVFILLAPPAIALMSYYNLTGEVDSFAYIFYGFAFYLGLLLLVQVKAFLSGPFFVSWWAMLFPTAAVTNATFIMYEATGLLVLKWLLHIQILGLIALSFYLLFKTIQLVKERKLCVEG